MTKMASIVVSGEEKRLEASPEMLPFYPRHARHSLLASVLRPLSLAILSILTVTSTTVAQEPKTEATTTPESGLATDETATSSDPAVNAEAVHLIEQLADAEFANREAAQRKLLSMGKPARAALQSVVESQDIEQRLRARELLRELDRRSLWEPTLISRKVQGMLAIDLFRAIADESNNPIHWARTPKSFHQKVDADWHDVNYWQALDDLSSKSQIVPRVYDDPARAGIVLTHGDPGFFPVAYAGPLRFHLVSIRRTTNLGLNLGDGITDEQDSLDLTMSMTWEQRFALCRYAGRPTVVTAITDQKEDLGIERPTAAGIMHLSRRQRQLVFTSRIRPPTKPASRLKTLDIQLDLVAAGDFVTLEVTIGDQSPIAENSGYELELLERKEVEGRTELSLSWSRPFPYDKMNLTDMADEYLEVLDESGKVLPHHLHQVVGGRETVRYVVHVLEKEGMPARIRYNVALLKSERTLKFEFRDVPLPVAGAADLMDP